MLEPVMAELGIDGTKLLFMLVAAFVTAVFHSASGFAGALLLVIVLAPVLGIKTVVPVVAVAVIVSNVTRLWVFRHELVIPIYRSLVISSLPGILIGALVFVYLPAQAIAILLGIFMLVSVPGRRLMRKRGLKVSQKQFWLVGPVYGLVGGVTMGSGLILAPFFLGAGLAGAQMSAMTAALGITLNLTKTVVFGVSPLLNAPLIGLGLALGLCTIPGAYVGKWILHRTSARIHGLLVEAVVLGGALFFFSQGVAD